MILPSGNTLGRTHEHGRGRGFDSRKPPGLFTMKTVACACRAAHGTHCMHVWASLQQNSLACTRWQPVTDLLGSSTFRTACQDRTCCLCAACPGLALLTTQWRQLPVLRFGAGPGQALAYALQLLQRLFSGRPVRMTVHAYYITTSTRPDSIQRTNSAALVAHTYHNNTFEKG